MSLCDFRLMYHSDSTLCSNAGVGPVKRSTFLCSGCMREKKKSRQEKEVGKASFVGVEMGVDLARATVKSAAVLRTEDQSSAQVGHVNGYYIPGVGLEDECSRPGGDFDGFREVPSGGVPGDNSAVTALEHVEGLKAPMLRLSIKNGIREEDAGGLASMQVKDGLYAQRLQLVNECYPSSPKAKKVRPAFIVPVCCLKVKLCTWYALI
jgi:hypothetical protein